MRALLHSLLVFSTLLSLGACGTALQTNKGEVKPTTTPTTLPKLGNFVTPFVRPWVWGYVPPTLVPTWERPPRVNVEDPCAFDRPAGSLGNLEAWGSITAAARAAKKAWAKARNDALWEIPAWRAQVERVRTMTAYLQNWTGQGVPPNADKTVGYQYIVLGRVLYYQNGDDNNPDNDRAVYVGPGFDPAAILARDGNLNAWIEGVIPLFFCPLIYRTSTDQYDP